MENKTLIFGHKNPDTDSVASAIALSHLKNSLGENTQPFILDEINQETKFVLDYFGVEAPKVLSSVRIQMSDLQYEKIKGHTYESSILDGYHSMSKQKLRTLPIIDEKNMLLGIVTMKDIAMSLIQRNQRLLNTSYSNILRGIEGKALAQFDEDIEGSIIVTAYNCKTIEKMKLLNENTIVIVGDREDIVEASIKAKVKLIIITGEEDIGQELCKMARKNKINIIQTPHDTYDTSKQIYLTNYIGQIMVKENIVLFNEDEYLEECKDIIRKSPHSKFPITDKSGHYLGILGRGQIISPKKKKVILVDHNEYSQSARGIEEAEIVEIIDHHKIGDISTSLPITFRNSPVGSTNTIVYQMYKENKMELSKPIAGMLLSGIISDTLLLKSPTTAEEDKKSLDELVDYLQIDVDKFAMEMFHEGTDISGKDVEEVFYSDYKDFSIEGVNVGVAQVFTLNIQAIYDNIQEYEDLISGVNKNKEQYITLLVVTDIIKQGSYIFFNQDIMHVLEVAFNREIEQGTFIEGCVSRKKQVIPALIQGIQNTKA